MSFSAGPRAAMACVTTGIVGDLEELRRQRGKLAPDTVFHCHNAWFSRSDCKRTNLLRPSGSAADALVLAAPADHTIAMAKMRDASFSAAEPHQALRPCDQPGCTGEGAFRAPKSRHQVDSYYWFCLEHVRAYNAAWNYYAGMNEREIEYELRRDTVWQRPTWPLGWRTTHRPLKDPFEIIDGGPESTGSARERRTAPPGPEERAESLFGIVPPYTLAALKQRYKTLVKQNHPDANGGDKEAEERLKAINLAFALLKPRATT